MRNRKLILGGVGLAITALISAASIKNFYLWHDGMHNQVASDAISYQQEGAVLKIGEECYSIDEVDSITFDTPVSPSNMPRTRMMFDTGSSHDMKLRSSGTYSYVITTTGSDPYVSTRPLTRALPEDSCILTFEYRLNKRMPRFKVYFATPLSEERSAVLGLLEPTNLWQRASFDLYAHRTAFEWGRAGHYLRLDPGEAPDVTLEIRNIYLRRATAEEIAAREAATDHFKYIDNGKVRLGVDMQRGGSIFYFALSNERRNLLNHRDEGRFIQQSYYGESDGTMWGNNPWTWNPIQGGGCDGTCAQVRSFEIADSSLHVVSVPVHWAGNYLMPELEMEETITLKDSVAHLHYTFRNTGPGATSHPTAMQEMPAVFVDYQLDHLVFYRGMHPWEQDVLCDTVPGWPNESFSRQEEWAAYMKADGSLGLGVYTPGTVQMTAYRYGHGASTGESGDDCSYFAPLRYFAVEKGLTVEYDAYITIGDIAQIRARFYNIHECIDPDWRNHPVAEYFSLLGTGQNNLTVKQTGEDCYTIETTGGDPYVFTSELPYPLMEEQHTLTFEYICNQQIRFELFFSPPTVAERSMQFTLPPSAEWRSMQVDIAAQRAAFSWGNFGDYLRLDTGDGPGTVLQIRKLKVE